MLMSYAGIGLEHIDFVVDRSTVQQGRYGWYFAGEIARQQLDYIDDGGQCIVPVPRVHTIGREVPV